MMFTGGGQLLQVPNKAANCGSVSENGVIEMELQPLVSNNVRDTNPFNKHKWTHQTDMSHDLITLFKQAYSLMQYL